jgi:TonB family protein
MIAGRLGLALFMMVLLTGLCVAQTPKPIDREGLMEAVKLGGLGPQEIVGIIKDFGVDFRLTAEDEKQLRKLGADQRVIEAVKGNYKGVEEPAEPLVLPEGPPLTREQVVLVLQAGVEPGVLVKLLYLRGAAFMADRAAAGEILAAGGDKMVIGAVVVNQREAPAGPAAPVAGALKPRSVPAPAAAAGGAAPQLIRVPGAEQARKLVRSTPPEYPVLAARMGASGKVVLDVHIGADGQVTSAKAKSGHSLLGAAAVDAVLKWLYKPTLVNGAAVEVATEVEVTFNLRK